MQSISDPIDSFKGEYDFLSNFSYSPITYEGIRYRTVEHAFQAAKTLDVAERQRIAKLPTPGKAKKAGREVQLREDWEVVKVKVMAHLLLLKFSNAELATKLEATGDRELIEGNWWNDTFWGVCKKVGRNELGKLLMKIRKRNRNL